MNHLHETYQTNKKGVISVAVHPQQSFIVFHREPARKCKCCRVLHSPLQEDMNRQADHSPAKAPLIPFADRGIRLNSL